MNMTFTTTAGFKLEPVFTAPGALGFDGVEFGLRDALIQSSTGEAVFEQLGVEVPTSWSDRWLPSTRQYFSTLGAPSWSRPTTAATGIGTRRPRKLSSVIPATLT